jgi:hypothetical protein
MSAAPSAPDQLRQVVNFLTAALARVNGVKPLRIAGGKLEDAAAALSLACDSLKPQLVRMSIVFSAGAASPSTVDSFCSSSLPVLSALASNIAALVSGADDVRVCLSNDCNCAASAVMYSAGCARSR